MTSTLPNPALGAHPATALDGRRAPAVAGRRAPAVAGRRAFIGIISVALLATACLAPTDGRAATTGSGRVATESRSVGEFNSIALGSSMNLVVSQGDKTSVQVQADDNLLPLVETVVDGDRLQIRWKRGESVYSRSTVRVTVVTPRLTALSASGSGDIKLEAFTTPTLKLGISGSGNAVLAALTTDELGVSVSGSGDVRGAGKAGKLKVSIAGSGDVRLGEVKADDVTVSIAGSGDAAVHANKTLNVSIAGSGDVAYSGEASVKSSVAGSGSVKKK